MNKKVVALLILAASSELTSTIFSMSNYNATNVNRLCRPCPKGVGISGESSRDVRMTYE